MKTLLIRQPAGIGDIFMCQKIAKVISDTTEYKNVVWPVWSVYNYLNEYMVGDIDFVDENEDFSHKDTYLSDPYNIVKTDELLYLPLQRADIPLRVCICHNNPIAHCHMKYNFVSMDYSDWVNYFEFTRKPDREDALIDKLELDITKPYRLVNRHFGAPPHYAATRDIVADDDLPVVQLEMYDGFTLFDWLKILENAEDLHIVEGSLIYLLEKIQKDNVFVYSRHIGKNDDFSYMRDNFYNQTWKYIP